MRGVVLSILTIGAGYLVYSVGDTGGASQFSSDDAGFTPPVVHLTSTPPRIIHESSDPVLTEAPRDRASLARDLQRALARAGCYEGPITGKWTAASKDAMGAFLLAANAQLPIDLPDQTLLALATSNANVVCSKMTLAAGAPDAQPPQPAAASAGDQALIAHQWAPPDMLVPAKPTIAPKEEAATPPPPTVTLTADEAEAPRLAQPHETETPVTQTHVTETRVSVATTAGVVSDAPVNPILPATPPASAVIHFENGEAVAETDPSFAKKSPPPPPQKVTQHKSRSKRRPQSDYEQISSSISKSWKSMQRSLSAMFD